MVQIENDFDIKKIIDKLSNLSKESLKSSKCKARTSNSTHDKPPDSGGAISSFINPNPRSLGKGGGFASMFGNMVSSTDEQDNSVLNVVSEQTKT